MNKLRPIRKIHGGKYYLAPKICQMFPEHQTYVEPFGGCASVLLCKDPSPVEVYNDLNQDLYEMFLVLRDHTEQLHLSLSLTPYSEAEFDHAQYVNPEDTLVERVRKQIVRYRFSRGGRGDSFSQTTHRIRGKGKDPLGVGYADNVSAYLSVVDEELPLYVSRLRRVQILCQPAIKVIKTYDSPNTLFYCDPPYVPSTRTSPGTYGAYEMSLEDHEELAKLLNCVKGRVVLSGYNSEVYSDWYQNWNKEELNVPNNSAESDKKQRRVECLWRNF